MEAHALEPGLAVPAGNGAGRAPGVGFSPVATLAVPATLHTLSRGTLGPARPRWEEQG